MVQELPLLFPDLTDPMRRRVIVRQALDAIAKARASTFLAGTGPVCVLVWAPEGARWSIMTLATERFYASDFLRLSRRHLGMLQARLGAELVAHTRSDHPRAVPWLRFLGFHPDPSVAEPGQTSPYVRPWSPEAS